MLGGTTVVPDVKKSESVETRSLRWGAGRAASGSEAEGPHKWDRQRIGPSGGGNSGAEIWVWGGGVSVQGLYSRGVDHGLRSRAWLSKTRPLGWDLGLGEAGALQGEKSLSAPARNTVRAPGDRGRGASFKNESSTFTWLSCTRLVGSWLLPPPTFPLAEPPLSISAAFSSSPGGVCALVARLRLSPALRGIVFAFWVKLFGSRYLCLVTTLLPSVLNRPFLSPCALFLCILEYIFADSWLRLRNFWTLPALALRPLPSVNPRGSLKVALGGLVTPSESRGDSTDPWSFIETVERPQAPPLWSVPLRGLSGTPHELPAWQIPRPGSPPPPPALQLLQDPSPASLPSRPACPRDAFFAVVSFPGGPRMN